MPPGPHPGSAPTMKDVAREAGVSKALVSIVFRGVGGASEQTRERVFEAASRIGYRTNRTASLLASTRTQQIGIVLDLHNSFHAEVVDAVLEAADRTGYHVMMSPWAGRHDETRAIGTAVGFRCEALVLLGPGLEDARLGRLTSGLPVVCIGRDLALASADVVRSAEDRGMELVVDHLVEIGHRRIVHVDGGAGGVGTARRLGFEHGVRRHRLASRSTVVRGGTTEADGRRAATQLLRRPRLPSAVAAFNDHCALGVVDAFTRSGLRVPQDVSVTGFDDLPVSSLSAIDLTSVRQDTATLADWAVSAAVERLDGGRTQRRELVVDPQLVVRGSSAPPA